MEAYSKFERARLIGARALQLSMGAPTLLKLTAKQLEDLGYDPVRIATLELQEDKIPIEVVRPKPVRQDAA